jgi:integrase/recombinase XerD
MSIQESDSSSLIEQFRVYLKTDGYCAEVQRRYPPIARRFLAHLGNQKRAAETAGPSDVEGFLRREHRTYRKRHRRAPRHVGAWRGDHAAPARLVLRFVQGQWPVELAPTTGRDAFHRELLGGYDAWMQDLRGLAPVTRLDRVRDAQRFLETLGARGDLNCLRNLEVPDIDAYVRQRSAGLRRTSIKYVTVSLRIFLRYLHGSARTTLDLSGTVTSPTLYAYEGIPSALRPEDVKNVLTVTRQDRTAAGRRDYAIIMLLATYGLRAGEITALRLEDIDWKKDVLHVQHSKTGGYSNLPLLREPGEALLGYLESARPRTALREVFLCLQAPHRAFKDGSALYSAIRKRLTAAGVMPPGKKGPHAFRHARAVSLLRAAVPLKAIGDILGHRSALSTGAYLKLATVWWDRFRC